MNAGLGRGSGRGGVGSGQEEGGTTPKRWGLGLTSRSGLNRIREKEHGGEHCGAFPERSVLSTFNKPCPG